MEPSPPSRSESKATSSLSRRKALILVLLLSLGLCAMIWGAVVLLGLADAGGLGRIVAPQTPALPGVACVRHRMSGKVVCHECTV